MHEKASSRSKKWIWKTLVLLAALITGIGSWMAVSRLSSGPHAIMINDNPVVSVKSRNIAKEVLREVKFRGTDNLPGGSVRFTQHVTIRKSPVNMELSDMSDAVDALGAAVTVEIKSFAITADGAPVVTLPGREAAEETLRLVKQFYERKLGTLDTQSTFKEKIFIDEQFVDIRKFRTSPEDALILLTTISEKPLIHMVQRGDRAVKIANQYGITFDELQRMNLHTNLELLTAGSRLVIRRPKMPITVVSKAKVTKTVTVTPPPEVRKYGGARTGKRRMQVVAVYENGIPVSEEIVSQVTTWDRPRRSAPRKPAVPATVSPSAQVTKGGAEQPKPDL